LKTAGGAEIIREEEIKTFLKDSSRKFAVNLLVEYGTSKFGLYPTRDEKIALCRAFIRVFPSLATTNNDLHNIVMPLSSKLRVFF
jgi:hypothetical protein